MFSAGYNGLEFLGRIGHDGARKVSTTIRQSLCNSVLDAPLPLVQLPSVTGLARMCAAFSAWIPSLWTASTLKNNCRVWPNTACSVSTAGKGLRHALTCTVQLRFSGGQCHVGSGSTLMAHGAVIQLDIPSADILSRDRISCPITVRPNPNLITMYTKGLT